ncbi:hypothetical protein F7734_49110 [Scytonema sp. UIC 10036]|uniref:hypothetical protein n=1 Tax=Scytonema sp. UIC 10036 TaxID=2304196 RepID=UPI0012DACFEE|nr:hypothetical protein [Scytonema sp. UIC 10036]MUG99815.1 hypothetical protein [Scytonema sp. UIC 10036]
MTTKFFVIPHYEIDFRYSSQGSDLEIINDEGDVIASFVGERALKVFTLLMSFPTVSERDIYIDARIAELTNTSF